MPSPLLEISQATLRFGGLTAVNGFDLVVGENELVGLIGPNGAGKTTIFNLVTGLYAPSSGQVRLDGRDLAGQPVNRIVGFGVARTFQNIRLFRGLTAADNVRVACNLRQSSGPLPALAHGAGFRAGERAVHDRVDELLGLFNLSRFRDVPAGALPYGDQRRLEIVRCLATRPRLLLLDEPAAGMNAAEKTELIGLIRRIQADFKLSILLVEHSMMVVMGVCQRIAVLDHGVKIAEGTPAEIQANPKVIEAYLGEERRPGRRHV